MNVGLPQRTECEQSLLKRKIEDDLLQRWFPSSAFSVVRGQIALETRCEEATNQENSLLGFDSCVLPKGYRGIHGATSARHHMRAKNRGASRSETIGEQGKKSFVQFIEIVLKNQGIYQPNRWS